jgi:ADP-ribose pyrophosphatase YjhB (NUDIX family)
MLSVRGIEPHKGMLDSFGGFVDGAETLEQGLERELREELGLEPDQYEPPTFLCSAVGQYPFGGETLTVLSSLFYTRLKPGVVPVPADDVAAIETLDIATLDLSRLHDDDVRAGMRALRSALKHSA